MRISLGDVSKYLSFYLPSADKVVDKIGLQLGAVDEGVFDYSLVYKDALIVKVVEAKKIPETDHLNLCLIDDNGASNVKRNKEGLIQVVCGAPNVRAGIKTVYLPPSSIVPSTFYKEQFSLEAREIRGHRSYGMLASLSELAIGEDHSGIVEINKGNPGDSFAKIYELNDVIVDIENKMFTHRPDCFGEIGVAREISGIFNKKFHSPEWYQSNPIIHHDDDNLPFQIENKLASKVPRLTAISISNIEIKDSPLETKIKLAKLGIRPINNIVDITNLVMLETGQPLHAYDYYKVQEYSTKEPVILARSGKVNEELELLSGKKIRINKEDIVISTDKKAIGLAGIMGGNSTEVDDKTNSIILESACFDMYQLRRTSMHHGIFSDALTRFNKGQSPLQQLAALNRAIMLIKEVLPHAKVSYSLLDINHLDKEVIKRNSIHPPVSVSKEFINSRLELDLSLAEIESILTNTEFIVKLKRDDKIEVCAPFYRTDIEIKEDVVEEVGRLYGFQNIKDQPITSKRIMPVNDKYFVLNKVIRDKLSSAGANDMLSYSFTSENTITHANQDIRHAYSLVNPLSPVLKYYRLSITPSLLTKVHQNIKLGFDNFALFEIGKVHSKLFSKDDIPEALNSLSLVYTSKKNKPGAAYYYALKYLDYLLYGLTYDLIPIEESKNIPTKIKDMSGPYEYNRSALICLEGNIVGIVGEFKSSVTEKFKLPYYSAGFEILCSFLIDKINQSRYQVKSKYPEIKQDITLSVKSEINYSSMSVNLVNALSQILEGKDSYFEIDYLGNYSKDQKQINYTFRLTFGDYNQTLEDKQINNLLGKLDKLLNEKIGAKRI